MSPKCWRSAQVVEIDGVDLVDDLAQELAGLHVVVGVFEHAPHHAAAVAILAGDGQFLQRGEQFVVDEIQQRLAGDAFRVGGPGPPLELLRDRRAVVRSASVPVPDPDRQ